MCDSWKFNPKVNILLTKQQTVKWDILFSLRTQKEVWITFGTHLDLQTTQTPVLLEESDYLGQEGVPPYMAEPSKSHFSWEKVILLF